MPQLANNESRGFTHYFRMNATDLVAAGTAAKTIGVVPRGGIVTNAAVTIISAITGASDITLTLGVTGTAAGLIASTDLDALVAMVRLYLPCSINLSYSICATTVS